MPVLRGRRKERRALDQLLTGVRDGQSAVLVVRAEADGGKSALLEYLPGRATGCRVARAGGVESEMELPSAGLPAHGRLERHLRVPDTAADLRLAGIHTI